MKMKRTLSLVLALVMVLGTFGTVFAETVVETPETNVDAGALLKDLGVLVGNAEGDLMLEEGLKRQDAVILLAKLMGEFDVAADFPTVEGEVPTYEDIEDNFYLPFLAWAQANETFVGHTPANFGFNEEMTVQQYAKVLLTVLGHEVGPDADVKWEDVMDTAKDLGLVDTTEEVGFTRGVMAMMTYNALNTKMKDSDQTLAEFLDIEMPEVEAPEAEELKIEKVYTENLAEVVVELSNAKLAENREALTNPSNYRINGVTVHNVDVVGNELVLTLVPYGDVDENVKVLTKGATHSLTIRNVKGISETVRFEARDLAVPTVENVEFLGTHGIKVTTSEPVMNPQERNFRLDDKRTSMVIEQYGRELILTPYHNQKFDLDAEKLVINELNDFAGYRSASSFEDIQELKNDAAPVVEKAYRNGNKLTLVFDRDIYQGSVAAYSNRRAEGNVSFAERRVTFFAEEARKVNTNVAEYIFEREIPRDAVVTVVGVENHNLKAMDKQDIETMLFEDDYAPVVISGLSKNVLVDKAIEGTDAVTTQGMKIEFDKNIKELEDVLALRAVKDADKDSLKDELNKAINVNEFFKVYKLEVSRKGALDAENVKVIVEAVTVDSITVSFENVLVNNRYRDHDYVLEVQNFTDLNRNRMEREYIDFQVVTKGSAFAVVGDVVAAQVGNNVEVTIEFNQAVNKSEAENPKNYYFGEFGKDLIVDTAIVERDGKTVSLVILNTKLADFLADYQEFKLELSPRITNLSGDSVAGTRFFDILTGRQVAEKSAAAVDALISQFSAQQEEITVEFIEKVEAAREAYDDLTAEAKALVIEANVNKLKAAEEKIANLTKELAAQKAEAAKLLEEDHTEESWEALEKALNLPETTKKEISVKVIAIKAAMGSLMLVDGDSEEDIAAAEEVDKLISRFGANDDVTEEYIEKVEAARAAYDDLTAEAKALVIEANVEKLEAVEAKIAGLEAAEAALELIIAYANLERDHEDLESAYNAAFEAIDALANEEVKTDLMGRLATNLFKNEQYDIPGYWDINEEMTAEELSEVRVEIIEASNAYIAIDNDSWYGSGVAVRDLDRLNKKIDRFNDIITRSSDYDAIDSVENVDSLAPVAEEPEA